MTCLNHSVLFQQEHAMAVFNTFSLAFFICSVLAYNESLQFVYRFDETLPVDFSNQIREYHDTIEKIFEQQLSTLEKLETIITTDIDRKLQLVRQTTSRKFEAVLKVIKYLREESDTNRQQIAACDQEFSLQIVNLVEATGKSQVACVKDNLDKFKAIPDFCIVRLQKIRRQIANSMEDARTCKEFQCSKILVQNVTVKVGNVVNMARKAVQDVKTLIQEAIPLVAKCVYQSEDWYKDRVLEIGAEFEDCVRSGTESIVAEVW